MTYSKEQYDNDLAELQAKFKAKADLDCQNVYAYMAIVESRLRNFESYSQPVNLNGGVTTNIYNPPEQSAADEVPNQLRYLGNRIADALKEFATSEDRLAARDQRYWTILLKQLVTALATTNGNSGTVKENLAWFEKLIYGMTLPEPEEKEPTF